MSRSINAAMCVVKVAVFAAVFVACSRRSSGAAATDSAAPRDSIISATIAKPNALPSGALTRGGPTGAAGTARKPGAAKSAARSARVGGGNVGSPMMSGRPHLTKLTPSSGSLASGQIVTVEVTGTGLTAAGNTVFFGFVRLGDLPSPDGRTIRFAVPQTVPSGGEVPPMAIQPGTYAVYVVNANGASDTLRFTVRDQQP